jgi:hypothetical protein
VLPSGDFSRKIVGQKKSRPRQKKTGKTGKEGDHVSAYF